MVHPLIPAVLSFIIPGLGQAVAGDIKKGIIFFVIAIVIAIIASLIFKDWLVYILNLLYAIYAAYDAHEMAA
ncbi:hypothetical protein [Methanobrevibacter sp.]|uniref:hypothetical protein n=1 Tax=Methanobrevibacter sp. TaxID=66852 RepID=UPI00386BDD5A